MAREGRGGTAQARSLRPQGTQASPLEVWSIPDRSGTSHDPHSGCSHGDRGNLHLSDPGSVLFPIPWSPKGTGERIEDITDGTFLSIFPSSGEDGSLERVHSEEIFFPIRVPSGGREAKEGRMTSGARTSGKGPRTYPFRSGGSQVPSVHHDRIPEGILPWFLGGALEGWEPISLTRPGGWVRERNSFFHGSVPLGGTCLPVCRGIGEPLFL
jgi:hypothetical protein